MAIVRAIASGNWSNTAIWNTGALPTSADDVYSNTFTVTIDISPTVLRISNAATTGVTAGGNFVPTNGVSLTCTGAGVVAGSATCISYGLSANQSFTVNGNIQAGTSSSAHGIATVAAGTLNIVGNVSGGSTGSSFAYGITCGASSTATINVTGNVNGGTGSSWTSGIDVQGGSPVISVTGAVTASSGSTSYGIFIKGGTITVIGQLIANGTHAFYSDSASASYTLQHTGSAQASSTGSGVASLSTNASHVLSGPFLVASNGFNAVFVPRWFWANSNVTPTYYQIRTANLATIRPLYTADSVGGNPATSNVRSGTVYGPAGELTGTCAVPGASSVLSGVPVDNTTGTATVSAASIRSALGLASANLDTQLAAIPTSAAPSAGDIAAAVWAAGSRTLTTTIASASDIAAAVWSAVTRTLTSNAAPSAADVATAVRTELATELARLDAAISTRLATSAYTTPPTASAIATAVNSALDRTGFSLTSGERSAIATAVEQSILNESDGQAILNAIVGAIGNQNIDQVALVAAIRADLERTGGTLATRSTLTAAQVRTELAPELGNLDATVSSRLPSSGYTAPPSAVSIATAVWSAATRTLTTAFDNSATIASAVWSAVSRTLTANPGPSAADNATAVRSELSTELGRIDTTISSRLAPSGTLARVTLTDTATTLTNAPSVPSPATVASAVRTELTPELARLSNAATTQEVGDIVEGALD